MGALSHPSGAAGPLCAGSSGLDGEAGHGTEASGSEDSGGAGLPVLDLKEESKGTPARRPTGHLSNSKQANQPQTRKQTSRTPGCLIHSEFQINAA